MTEERLSLAQAFLQEAVYRSRARQAAGTSLFAGGSAGDAGQCGLGEKAAVELDLSERGQELFDSLWPSGLDDAARAGLHEAMRRWVTRQDALDRKRNHFLRDFRQTHGFDRGAYSADETKDFEAGLAAVNTEVASELEAAARTLLG
ncbi:MAG: hypothetical protein AAF682_18490 [Planctomycetota bacterium]